MTKIKLTYILSNIDKAIAFEWIVEKIDKSKFELSFILLNSKEPYLFNWLQKRNIESYYIKHSGKKNYIISFFRIIRLLYKLKPAVIHTHLLDANLLGLSAGKLLGIKNRIYTRHHSTYHHDNFPKAVKYDKWSNLMATNIVAITKNVKNILLEKENVPEEKISLTHHGFHLEKFEHVSQEEIDQIKIKYKIADVDSPIIGVIARHIEWKGIQYIVPAFKNLLKEYPDSKLILANASGPYAPIIQQQLSELPEDSYVKIKFEPNLFALYKLFDIYIHVPIDSQIEAFGQTYVEALASGVPSIFTLSGVANEYIKDKENALVVNYRNSIEIENALKILLTNNQLSRKLVENGKISVRSFNLEVFVKKLELIYD